MMILPVKTAARLAQSVDHETLNLGVVGSSPTLGDLRFRFCLTLGQTKHTVKFPTYNSLYCIHILALKIAHQYLFEISNPGIGNQINHSWNINIPRESIYKIVSYENHIQFNMEIKVNKNLLRMLYSHLLIHAEIYIYMLDTYWCNDKDPGRLL